MTFASPMPMQPATSSMRGQCTLVTRRRRCVDLLRGREPSQSRSGGRLGERLDTAAIATATPRTVGHHHLVGDLARTSVRAGVEAPVDRHATDPVPSVTQTTVRQPRPAPIQALGERECPRR